MAATGYTTIQPYYSITATNVPLAANMVTGELAINTVDGKLYYKNSSGVVTLLASTTNTNGTFTTITNTGLTAGRVVYSGTGGLEVDSANLTFSGTVLAVTGAVTATADSTFNSTGAIQIPAGTTAQQPTGVNGKIRYNSTLSRYEGYSGSTWGSLGGGATGGGGDQVFVQNGVTVTTNYTLTTNYNAESVGPISINSGVIVTIPSNQRWVIL